jgi:hypothetical protein
MTGRTARTSSVHGIIEAIRSAELEGATFI